MSASDELERMTVSISPELKRRVVGIPWGMRRHVIEALLRGVLDAADEHGEGVFAAVLSGEYTLVPNNVKDST